MRLILFQYKLQSFSYRYFISKEPLQVRAFLSYKLSKKYSLLWLFQYWGQQSHFTKVLKYLSCYHHLLFSYGLWIKHYIHEMKIFLNLSPFIALPTDGWVSTHNSSTQRPTILQVFLKFSCLTNISCIKETFITHLTRTVVNKNKWFPKKRDRKFYSQDDVHAEVFMKFKLIFKKLWKIYWTFISSFSETTTF